MPKLCENFIIEQDIKILKDGEEDCIFLCNTSSLGGCSKIFKKTDSIGDLIKYMRAHIRCLEDAADEAILESERISNGL